MTQPIDVLLVEPHDADARRTLDAIHRKAPEASTVRVLDFEQAGRLIFEHGLFSERPQIPGLLIVDVAATDESARVLLRRLKDQPATQDVPIVVFSASRDQSDILQNHLLGVQMSIVKPNDSMEYAFAVERIVATWLKPKR